MSDKILRHGHPSDTAANWKANNPVIGKGEFAIESDTGKFKIGDGINSYNDIDYNSSLVETELERLNYYGDKDIIPSDESYFTVNETGETITGLTDAGKTQTELVIPYEINGKKITTLFSGKDGNDGPPASILDGNNVITKVVIPKSVTTLGGAAFWGCRSLTSINIPNSITTFGNYGTFDYCTSLTSINIPNNITSIGDSAFGNCTSLTSINIPNSVTSIGRYAFHVYVDEGASFSYIPIPGLTIYCEQGSYAETYAKENNISVVYTDVKGNIAKETELERLQYYGDKDIVPSDENYFNFTDYSEGGVISGVITGLTEAGKTQTKLVIPYRINGVKITSIGNRAFYKCTSLTSINIPNSVTYIANAAFDSCTSLTSINIPNSVTSIDHFAFDSCTSLTSIDIPNSVTSIGDGVFARCTSLASINIPNSVTSIGWGVFEDCTSLTSINIPNSVTSIDNTAFNNIPVSQLTIYCEQGSYAETYAQENGFNIVYTKVKDMTTKTELERLKYYGDKDILPSDESYFVVNETGETITGLTETGKTQTELVIPYEINGVKITTLFSGSDGHNGPSVSILNGNNVITKVVIPKSVTTLGGAAFFGCTSLTSINIPNSVTTLGDFAFQNCTSLTSINIPDSVVTIGNHAFDHCASLTSINIPNSVTVVNYGTFRDCTSLTSINIPNSVTSIIDQAFENCTSLTSITIPNSVTSIVSGSSFSGCTNLTIYCEQGSYAETYASANNTPVVYTNLTVELLDKHTSIPLNLKKGDGEYNSQQINNFISEIKTKGYKHIIFQPGTYEISSQLQFVNLPIGCTIDFNGATFKYTNTSDETKAVTDSLTGLIRFAPNAVGDGTSLNVKIKNLNLDGAKSAYVGLYIDGLQEFICENINIKNCACCLALKDTYYGSFVGYNILRQCLCGLALVGEDNKTNEINTINFSNFKINSSHYTHIHDLSTVVSTLGSSGIWSNHGISISCIVNAVNLSAVIEGDNFVSGIYAEGMTHDKENTMNCSLSIMNCYFEALNSDTCAEFVDKTGKLILVWNVLVENCRSFHPKFVCASGKYRFINNSTIRPMYQNTMSRTTIIDDTKYNEYSSSDNHFVKTAQQPLTMQSLYNPTDIDIIKYGGTNVYPSYGLITALSTSPKDIALVTGISGYTAAKSVGMRSFTDINQVFLRGASPIIESQDGTYWKLSVSKDGELKTTKMIEKQVIETANSFTAKQLWNAKKTINTLDKVSCIDLASTIQDNLTAYVRTDDTVNYEKYTNQSDSKIKAWLIASTKIDDSSPQGKPWSYIIGEGIDIYNYYRSISNYGTANSYLIRCIDIKTGAILGLDNYKKLRYVGSVDDYSRAIDNSAGHALEYFRNSAITVEDFTKNGYNMGAYCDLSTGKYYMFNLETGVTSWTEVV